MDPEKYFSTRSFAALCLVTPATIIIIIFFLGAFNIHAPFGKIMNLQRSHYLVSLSIFLCFTSIVITIIDLLLLNYSAGHKNLYPEYILNKSYFNIGLISFPYFYLIILFFFIEFDKLGNIPVGRN